MASEENFGSSEFVNRLKLLILQCLLSTQARFVINFRALKQHSTSGSPSPPLLRHLCPISCSSSSYSRPILERVWLFSSIAIYTLSTPLARQLAINCRFAEGEVFLNFNIVLCHHSQNLATNITTIQQQRRLSYAQGLSHINTECFIRGKGSQYGRRSGGGG